MLYFSIFAQYLRSGIKNLKMKDQERYKNWIPGDNMSLLFLRTSGKTKLHASCRAQRRGGLVQHEGQ